MSATALTPELLVANSILNTAFKDGHGVSSMKLQKLIYFVYKRYLQETGSPLFDEHFEVWQYGPVLPSVYHEFKAHGSANISDYAYSVFDVEKKVFVVNEKAKDFYDALNYVWKNYRNYSATDLSKLTHREGTAWDRTLKKNQLYISDEDIKRERWES